MELKFTKMHGCGNDYVYINCFEHTVEYPRKLAVQLADRHFGIGGDGLILVCPPDSAENDCRMKMFNADGSEGKMCGNGIRCVAKFMWDNGIKRRETLSIETPAGVKRVTLHESGGQVTEATVEMGPPVFEWTEIPLTRDAGRGIMSDLVGGTPEYPYVCLSMGNPHCVFFVDDLDVVNFIGKKIENHPLFPERVNAEFVSVIDKENIELRVWERGSGETLACGTGICAAAVAAAETGRTTKAAPVSVKTPGGVSRVLYNDTNVYLSGDAVTVFSGVINV